MTTQPNNDAVYKKTHFFDRGLLFFLISLFFLLGFSACNSPLEWNNSSDNNPEKLPNDLVTVDFKVNTLPTEDNVYIDIIDDVTGVPYNPIRYQMVSNGIAEYSLQLPISKNSLIKYRYIKHGDKDSIEVSPDGNAVNYRVYYAADYSQANDIVYGWTDSFTRFPTGKITGQINDQNGNPVQYPVLIYAAGLKTVTDSLGIFTLNNVPLGTCNLVVISPNGSYKPFQQGARVEANAITQANIRLVDAPQVNVSFLVAPPLEMPDGDPSIKLIGNLNQTGHSFAIQAGNVSTDPYRAPNLIKQTDGTYAYALKLPVDYDFQYKYSLGDSFWNAEHDQQGRFVIRKFIVPDHDVIIKDEILTWGIPGLAPITFNLNIPENTPGSDLISIQLSAFSWMQPLPMQISGQNARQLTLYPPFPGLVDIQYRYCRNQICGAVTGPEAQPENTPVGLVKIGSEIQNIQDQVSNWSWWQNPSQSFSLTSEVVNPRNAGFISAIEFIPERSPSQYSMYFAGINQAHQLGANWIILSPQWDLAEFPTGEPSINHSFSEQEIITLTRYSQDNGISVALFPVFSFPIPDKTWWEDSNRDLNWWNQWFETYRQFALSHASQAEKAQAGALILGGPSTFPAMPNGVLRNNQNSGVFQDASNRWVNLIKEVKNHYHGKIIWAVADTDLDSLPEEITNEVDWIYLLLSYPNNNQTVPSAADFKMLLDTRLGGFVAKMQKPIFIGIEYPSSGTASECQWLYSNTCWQNNLEMNADFGNQFKYYAEFFNALNQYNGISGVSSRGFNPDGAMDPSTSINSKPASGLLWYWYPRWLSPAP